MENLDNFQGQLGTGDHKYKQTFTAVERTFPQKIIDMAAGFQHSLFLAEDGACYGSGRCNWKQFMPYISESKKESLPSKLAIIENKSI